MLIKYLFLILIFIQLNASSILQKTYYINSNDINISSIIKNIDIDKNLFNIQPNKYSKRVKSKLLIKILKQHGYMDFKAQSNYITFKKKSYIDTSKIQDVILKYYKQKYDIIEIQKIDVNPRSYITHLPQDFSVHLRKRDFLSNHGIVNIKTPKNKRIFFDYMIKAKLPVYITKTKLKMNTEISELNTEKKSIVLNRLKAKPIQQIIKNTLQVKYNINKNKILTSQNIEKLNLIKRGASINIILHDSGIDISFTAKALRNAKMGDIVTVENKNKKRFKVKVIGKNKAEM